MDEDARRPADQQRVAIGSAFRDVLRRDARAGAGAVVDHDRLAEHAPERLGEGGRDEVGGAARRKAGDQPDRFRRIRLREGLPDEAQSKEKSSHESAPSSAASSAPSFGGLDSSPTLTPASRSAAEAT